MGAEHSNKRQRNSGSSSLAVDDYLYACKGSFEQIDWRRLEGTARRVLTRLAIDADAQTAHITRLAADGDRFRGRCDLTIGSGFEHVARLSFTRGDEDADEL